LRRPYSAIRILVLGILLGLAAPRAYAAMVSDPVFIFPSGGDSGWVGSTYFSFSGNILLFQGRIMYTLDGTPPAKDVKGSTYRYELGTEITLSATTIVRAIHVQGANVSDEVSHEFIRAKVPTPVARYGGSAHFSPSLICTLTVASTRNASTLRYALLDPATGTAATPFGAYAGAFTLAKSANLRAVATATGYDASDTLKVAFVLDTVATPTINPGSGSFATGTLTVRMQSATSGANIRYATGANPGTPDKWTLMTGDSVSFQSGKDGDSIILQAQAFVNANRTSKVQTAKYVYLPAVAAPAFTPGSKTFFDTLWIRMASPTPGANVRYTDNGTTPTTASLDGNVPVLLKKSDTLIAKAFKDKHDASPAAKAAYILRLSPPTVDRPEGEYTGSLTVHLQKVNPDAQIFYSLSDSTAPALGADGRITNGVLYDPASGIILTKAGATLLRAIAVVEGVSSELARFTYTRQSVITTYSVPTIDPPSREFIDTLSIRLTAADTGAVVMYSLTADGLDTAHLDLAADPARPIRLDSSAVLLCRTVARTLGKPLLPSQIRTARYTLKPSAPVAYPLPSDQPVPAGTVIMLRSRTKGGIIHYATNQNSDLGLSQGFPDSVPITLNGSTSLYALTAIGSGASRAFSDTLALRYEVYTSAASDTLAVDGIRPIAGGFAYRNASGHPILAKAHTAEGMGLSGFADMSLIVSLQPAAPGQSLIVAFSKPAGGKLSLYRYAGGAVELVSPLDSALLTMPGDYFTAIDVQPPAISVVEQSAKDGDSTAVILKITDNVSHPSCTITSPGLKGGALNRQPGSGDTLVVKVKGPNAGADPMWLRVVARDAYDSSRLPADPNAKIFVARYWSSLVTPVGFIIGKGSGKDLWDLAGLPVGSGAGLTWSRLAGANPDMQACVWGPNGYEMLDESAEIGQGMAFWIGSRTEHSAFTVPSLLTGASEPDGSYRIHLKPGWNQVTSPSLGRVFWPVTPKVSQGGTATLKAPYSYVRETRGWHQTDTLEPWIGYFVNYYGNFDTVITVYTAAASRPAAKTAAGPAPSDLGMTIASEGIPSLRLGARAFARDEYGPEDEPQPPAWGHGASAWSQRGAGRLLTDLVRYQPGGVARWQVILDPGAVGKEGSERSGAAGPTEKGLGGGGGLKLAELALPTGYQAWAVSRARGVKFRLEAGAVLPVPADGPDTLSVFAGPTASLRDIGELERAPERISAFAFALERSRGRSFLRLELPWNGQVEASIYALSGRLMYEIRKEGLMSGIYRLPLSGLPAQSLVLRLRVNGPRGPQAFTRSFVP
jgi:hypothetical protein